MARVNHVPADNSHCHTMVIVQVILRRVNEMGINFNVIDLVQQSCNCDPGSLFLIKVTVLCLYSVFNQNSFVKRWTALLLMGASYRELPKTHMLRSIWYAENLHLGFANILIFTIQIHTIHI